jgi:hypothetical protein
MRYVFRICGRLPLVAVLIVLPALAGCANGPQSFTQEGRVGPDDGTDSCHAEAVALDNTGDFFGEDILKGAAMGALGGAIIGGIASGNLRGALIGAAAGGAVGAAGGYWAALQKQSQDVAQLDATVASDLTRENDEINATQIAFNNDMDCRFGQAAQIREAYKDGSITEDQAVAQMAQVKTLAQRDLQLAQTINSQIQSRGAQFDTAATNLDGAPAPAEPTLSKPAVARRAEPLYLRPDSESPVIGKLAVKEDVTITSVIGGYALVQADDGSTGYIRLAYLRQPTSYRTIYVPPSEQLPAAVDEPRASDQSSTAAYVPPAASDTGAVASTGSGASTASAAPLPPATPRQVKQLDGSNAASRDAFAQNVSVSQSAVSNGFQLATT